MNKLIVTISLIVVGDTTAIFSSNHFSSPTKYAQSKSKPLKKVRGGRNIFVVKPRSYDKGFDNPEIEMDDSISETCKQKHGCVHGMRREGNLPFEWFI